MSRLESQKKKGIFDPYVLWPFDKKVIFPLVTGIRTPDYAVCTKGKAMYVNVNSISYSIPYHGFSKCSIENWNITSNLCFKNQWFLPIFLHEGS